MKKIILIGSVLMLALVLGVSAPQTQQRGAGPALGWRREAPAGKDGTALG